MVLRIGINEFKPTARLFLRASREARIAGKLEITAITCPFSAQTLAHSIRHDSTYEQYLGEVNFEDNNILILDGKKIEIIYPTREQEIPWGRIGTDLVIDSTTMPTSRKNLKRHIEGGARYVLLTKAPAIKYSEVDKMILFGLNDQEIDWARHIILTPSSAATNCIAPPAKILNDNFGICYGFITTIQSPNTSGSIHNKPNPSTNQNIIARESTTAYALGHIFPEFAEKLTSTSIYVPTPNGSYAHLSAQLSRKASEQEINHLVKKASISTLANILEYREKPIVSSDVRENPKSCIFDSTQTKTDRLGQHVSISAWYDGEWSLANRCLDITLKAKEYLKK
jgi:glyceraldehyde 3-phosphate dehydrogenase